MNSTIITTSALEFKINQKWQSNNFVQSAFRICIRFCSLISGTNAIQTNFLALQLFAIDASVSKVLLNNETTFFKRIAKNCRTNMVPFWEKKSYKIIDALESAKKRGGDAKNIQFCCLVGKQLKLNWHCVNTFECSVFLSRNE